MKETTAKVTPGKAKPRNVLSIHQSYELHTFMQTRRDEAALLTGPQVAELAAKELGFPVVATNIYPIKAYLGIKKPAPERVPELPQVDLGSLAESLAATDARVKELETQVAALIAFRSYLESE